MDWFITRSCSHHYKLQDTTRYVKYNLLVSAIFISSKQFQYQVQWRLRYKITVCHTEENYLKHVTLLNRFKIVFLLNRDIGLRETYLKPNIWVLESPGLGSRALKGQAVAVAPNRSVESAFRNIYAILPCVGGPTRSTILPCCVLAEYILLRIYCRINCSLSQGYSNIIYTL